MSNQSFNLPHLPSFPKIFHIGERQITELFNGVVEITEKVDGSQFNFGKDKEGELVYRSKGQDLTYRPTPKMFELADNYIHSIDHKIPMDTYFFCEFLNKPHHNVLNYERVPKNNLYLFGVMEGQVFVNDASTLYKYADSLGIERPNILFSGLVNTIEELEVYLLFNSILGREIVEGIVVKNYNQCAVITSNLILPMAMGKYVNEKYKERHNKDWKQSKSRKGKLEMFIQSFRSEARWQKAVQHLREADKLEGAPRDIGNLIKEIAVDLTEEEAGNIKEGLYKIFKKDIVRAAQGGFPEWYKEQLAKQAF